jgi:hypothetical protein
MRRKQAGVAIPRYRSAVNAAWADEGLNEAEKGYLSALETELGLVGNKADDVEREVMGKIKEVIPSDGVDPPPPPDASSWLGLVEECVGVLDELDRHAGSFDPARRELTEHAILRLEEVLERSGIWGIHSTPRLFIMSHAWYGGDRSLCVSLKTAATMCGSHLRRTRLSGKGSARCRWRCINDQ